jgi:hypothetical protein
MNDPIEELRDKLKEAFFKKEADWTEKIYKSQQYQQELKYLKDMSKDFVDSLRYISIYSTRAGEIYNNFLCIRTIDDLIQSAIGILSMVENGIHNTVRRELRFLIEMITKYVLVDYAKMEESFQVKTDYLKDEVPSSSIEVIEDYQTPFSGDLKKEFRNEMKDFFYKSCAYVHPSKRQIDEQMRNFENGNTIGFESAKMLTDINRTIFRAYDMILAMVFHSFGHSMSKDLFEQMFNDNTKWKFHKGKYTKAYKELLFI